MIKVEFYFETHAEATRVIREVAQRHNPLPPPPHDAVVIEDIYNGYERDLNDDDEVGGEA